MTDMLCKRGPSLSEYFEMYICKLYSIHLKEVKNIIEGFKIGEGEALSSLSECPFVLSSHLLSCK